MTTPATPSSRISGADKLNRSIEGTHHIPELQSLRGLAALVVAASHISSIYDLRSGARISIDAVLNAHASLIVFFVLSGYVLAGSLLRRGLSLHSVFGFYVARLFRLFPALWVASAFSVLFLWLYPQKVIHPAMSFWFFFYLISFPSGTELLLAALAIDRSLIMPVWTIFIELVGSLLMPLLVAVACARRQIFYWVLAATALAALTLAGAPHRLNALVFLFDFALGAWLASRDWKFVVGRTLPKILCSAFALIFFRFLWEAIRSGRLEPLYFGYDDPVPMVVEGIAAFFLVGLLASEHGRSRLLRAPAAIWLGNISYSLYLIHFPVAILVAKLFSRVFSERTNPATATASVMAVSLALSFGLASLMYRFVELPSIALGKRVNRFVQRTAFSR